MAPVIQDVLDALSHQDDVELVRMSGSGATCFALFSDHDACHRAAGNVQRHHPDWWVSTARACN
jgi:4-diphosphocytidyl-2-C-methyl-D-erythritol kinase